MHLRKEMSASIRPAVKRSKDETTHQALPQRLKGVLQQLRWNRDESGPKWELRRLAHQFGVPAEIM